MRTCQNEGLGRIGAPCVNLNVIVWQEANNRCPLLRCFGGVWQGQFTEAAAEIASKRNTGKHFRSIKRLINYFKVDIKNDIKKIY